VAAESVTACAAATADALHATGEGIADTVVTSRLDSASVDRAVAVGLLLNHSTVKTR
jgi:hypothetical protein